MFLTFVSVLVCLRGTQQDISRRRFVGDDNARRRSGILLDGIKGETAHRRAEQSLQKDDGHQYAEKVVAVSR